MKSATHAGKRAAVGTKAVAEKTYTVTRKTITQEEAFEEIHQYLAEVTEVLAAIHARVTALEHLVGKADPRRSGS